jgi:sodium-dependent dicarboxylate transporter 2/3/5
MHWGLIFVLGGGFAIAAGSQSSGLSSMLGNALIGLKSMSPIWILFIVCVFAETVTELTSNVAVANIILPVLAEMVRMFGFLILIVTLISLTYPVIILGIVFLLSF